MTAYILFIGATSSMPPLFSLFSLPPLLSSS